MTREALWRHARNAGMGFAHALAWGLLGAFLAGLVLPGGWVMDLGLLAALGALWVRSRVRQLGAVAAAGLIALTLGQAGGGGPMLVAGLAWLAAAAGGTRGKQDEPAQRAAFAVRLALSWVAGGLVLSWFGVMPRGSYLAPGAVALGAFALVLAARHAAGGLVPGRHGVGRRKVTLRADERTT